MILVSSCLIGLKCRYDGIKKADSEVMSYLEGKEYLPVCPEQMGGLATPRYPAEIITNNPLKIVNNHGDDVTGNFVEGANQVLEIIKDRNITLAILKAKSPSCGSESVYDGTFSNILISGEGVLSMMLRQNKIKVISEKKVGTINE